MLIRSRELCRGEGGITERPSPRYKDMVQGTGAEFTPDKKAVIDWDGYTLGYYGRPFEAGGQSIRTRTRST